MGSFHLAGPRVQRRARRRVRAFGLGESVGHFVAVGISGIATNGAIGRLCFFRTFSLPYVTLCIQHGSRNGIPIAFPPGTCFQVLKTYHNGVRWRIQSAFHVHSAQNDEFPVAPPPAAGARSAAARFGLSSPLASVGASLRHRVKNGLNGVAPR